MVKQALFIINQASGTDRRKTLEDLLAHHLDASVVRHEIAFTAYRGHATELAREGVKNGAQIIAAVGGDGSVNEVAQGMLGSSAALAVIPAGSGNGLARALGISRSAGRAIRLLNAMNIRRIDVGWANDKLFLSNAGVGFDALIARLFAKNTGRGLTNYAKLVIGSFKKYQSKHYHLETDQGEFHEQAFFVAAANGNQFGYDFKIAPDAELDDGLLDICIMQPLKMRDLPLVSVQALAGKLQNNVYASHVRCRSVVITREEPLEWMQVDGDAFPVENGKVTIRVQPHALPFIVP